MKVIKGIYYVIALPWFVVWEAMSGRWGKNTGHTAGLCEGFLSLAAVISGLIQVFILTLAFVTWIVIF